jgi:hypothetical protein
MTWCSYKFEANMHDTWGRFKTVPSCIRCPSARRKGTTSFTVPHLIPRQSSSEVCMAGRGPKQNAKHQDQDQDRLPRCWCSMHSRPPDTFLLCPFFRSSRPCLSFLIPCDVRTSTTSASWHYMHIPEYSVWPYLLRLRLCLVPHQHHENICTSRSTSYLLLISS